MAISRTITKGATSQSVELRAVTTATGTPVTITSATAGLALWYRRGGTGLKVAITASDLALLSTAWADGGLLLIGDGVHRLDVADAAFATGAPNVTIGGSATGINIEPCDVQLTSLDLQTALPSNFASASIDSSGRIKAQNPVQKNTALAGFAFLMTDSTNHNPATGKTVTCTRSIDGGAFGAGTLTAAGVAVEVASGIYYTGFAAGDLNGSTVVLRCTAANCDDTLIVLNPST